MKNTIAFFFLLSMQIYFVYAGNKNEQLPKSYKELPDPARVDLAKWTKFKGIYASWGSTDIRYPKSDCPDIQIVNKKTIEVWRGERCNVQALVWTGEFIPELTFELTSFRNSSSTIPASAFSGGFIRYVMTDELNKDKNGACGQRPDHTKFDSSLVADPIDKQISSISVKKMSVQPVWVSCDIPDEIAPGIYTGELILKNNRAIFSKLKLEIKILGNKLSDIKGPAFHLDLWQNPFSVARVENTGLWTDEHFNAMKPVFKMLAEAGQEVITTSIMHKPWNAQTEDYFETMITWMKKADGSWYYDYTIFDKWVIFMMDLGIDKQINCYTMVPWALNFQYYDQATNSIKFIKTAPGEKAYEDLWLPMLKSFSSHLKEKGWLDITTIAMDERPMEVMKKTIAIIRKADPDLKISLAGNYHGEIEKDIYDYSISLEQSFPKEVLARRKNEGKLSTYYSSCSHAHPNSFTFSDPVESVWLGFYLAKDDVDGFLRWAYNSWVKEPLLDSRFRTWGAGDTYLVYPSARSSVRFEKIREGIQLYNKIKILKSTFKSDNNQDGLNKMNEMLSMFRLEDFPGKDPRVTVDKAYKILKELSK